MEIQPNRTTSKQTVAIDEPDGKSTNLNRNQPVTPAAGGQPKKLNFKQVA
jgi:hypothetical protein